MRTEKSIGKDLWLIEGVKRWAIYDLQKGVIFQVRKVSALALIELFESEILPQEKRKILLKEAPSFSYFLRLKGSFNRLFEKSAPLAFPPRNYMLWIEVTDVCNQRCLHCYTSSDRRKGYFLDREVLKRVISQASELEFEQLQFTGGEPLLYPKIWDIISYLRDVTTIPVVELYTNLTLLRDKEIKLLKKYQVKIATTLLGSCSKIHDYCTGVRGSFDILLKNLRKIRDEGIEFRVGVIKLAENENDMENIERLLRKEKFISFNKSFTPDEVRPVGRGERYLNLNSNQKWPLYLHINPEYFYTAHHWNTCWGGELAITSKGQVLPCIFARDEILGNVYHQNLKQIIESPKTQRFWKITSDKIEKCKDCEYRYACMDCRVLSIKAGEGLFGKPVRCDYDPYH